MKIGEAHIFGCELLFAGEGDGAISSVFQAGPSVKDEVFCRSSKIVAGRVVSNL